MTTGKWMPKSHGNRDMIANRRAAGRELQKERPGEVRIRHVRSHTGVPGNEVADWLADERGNGDRDATDNAREWLTQWFDDAAGAPAEMAKQWQWPKAPTAIRTDDTGDPVRAEVDSGSGDG